MDAVDVLQSEAPDSNWGPRAVNPIAYPWVEGGHQTTHVVEWIKQVVAIERLVMVNSRGPKNAQAPHCKLFESYQDKKT